VLIVDDNRDITQTLALLLEHYGHTVAVAHDGPTALTMAEETDPQVILLDVGLPGMDGYEVARRLRKDPRWQSVAIAAITGYGRDEDRLLAQSAGFNKHFTKPVDIEVLNDYVKLPSA
jgi:CheY-like chemotaxis protein